MANSKPKHTIYLVRHAECLGNVERKFLPPAEDLLTETGRKQINLLGKFLASENITRIYSSEYPRAYETAQGVLNASKNSDHLTILKDSRLVERAFGVLEGKDYKEGIVGLMQTGLHITKYDPPSGETWDELGKRISSFYNDILDDLDKSPNEETVVIVSHTFTIVKFLQLLTHPDTEDFFLLTPEFEEKFRAIKNASFAKMLIGRKEVGNAKRRLHVLTLDGDDHLKILEGEMANDTRNDSRSKTSEIFKGCVQS